MFVLTFLNHNIKAKLDHLKIIYWSDFNYKTIKLVGSLYFEKYISILLSLFKKTVSTIAVLSKILYKNWKGYKSTQILLMRILKRKKNDL